MSGVSVYELVFLYDFGEDDCICVCVRKMAVIASLLQCRVWEWKKNFLEWFYLQMESFANRSV